MKLPVRGKTVCNTSYVESRNDLLIVSINATGITEVTNEKALVILYLKLIKKYSDNQQT